MQFTFPELVIFAILSTIIIDAILIVFLLLFNWIDDYLDGTIRKKPGATPLRQLFKSNGSSSKE